MPMAPNMIVGGIMKQKGKYNFNSIIPHIL
jgi:hypothetical protein